MSKLGLKPGALNVAYLVVCLHFWSQPYYEKQNEILGALQL
jgi:hypothetical protein